MVLTRFSPRAVLKKFTVNRKYKDRLFQRIFRNRRDLLDLYNAVNHTDYTNPYDLEITTLEDVIYLSMKNDLSFIISLSLNLYEHQSTINPNITVRGFMYFARLYENYISRNNLNIYGSSPIMLPRPQFVVFYNGRKEQPDETILKLSDLFAPAKHENRYIAGPKEFADVIEPVLECRARILNINYGHNKELLDNCRRLHDYSFFIDEVNTGLGRGLNLKQAINAAIDTCLEHDILTDILQKNRNEVLGMLLTEYDEKKVLRMTYRDGKSEGLSQGLLDGQIKATIELYQEMQLPKEQAISKIITKYELSEVQADNYIHRFWK